ncbi:unnamed protein product [Amoebophrya sp. A25]|nr:unnamed protein product [Amoebophrya sp. A25]|eukprot:GSA25T00020127001.1
MPRTFLISGASSGVGENLACRLASLTCCPVLKKEGLAMHLLGRDSTNLERVASTCRDLLAAATSTSSSSTNTGEAESARPTFKVTTSICDLRNGNAITEMWERDFITAHGGKLDVLVANAGVNRVGLVEEQSDEDYDTVFDTNVRGVWNLVRKAVPLFKQQKSGQIVITNSVRGLRGSATATLYCGSKFALRGMQDCWRNELQPFGVKVGSVFPGGIDTPWWDSKDRGGRDPGTSNTKGYLQPEEVTDAMLTLINQRSNSNLAELRF